VTEPAFVQTIRTAYDTVAVDYAKLLHDQLAESPYDRAMLGAFAELVEAGPVADLGCGPGRVSAHLRTLGVDVFGVDLSPEMVAVARRTYPELTFGVGSMLALDLADDALGGIVAWYSIIHTPPELLPAIFAEFHRVLRPGAPLLVAFQVGDERKRLEQAYGHAITLDAYRLSPDRITELLTEAGLDVRARMVREPDPPYPTPQGYLFAGKPLDPA